MARVPSAKSAVCWRRSCSRCSWNVAASTWSARSARSVARIDLTASGADIAISRAMVYASDRTSSRGTRRSARPNCAASSPGTRRPGEQQVSGSLRTHQAGQGHAQAEALMEPETGEVGAEAGLWRGDPEVGRESQAQASAHRRTVHRGHHRRVGAENPDRGCVQVLGGVMGALGREIGASAEVLALRAQHRGPAAGVVVQRLEPVSDPVDHLQREEVVGRTPQLDGGHVVVADFDGQRVAHRADATNGPGNLGRCPIVQLA